MDQQGKKLFGFLRGTCKMYLLALWFLAFRTQENAHWIHAGDWALLFGRTTLLTTLGVNCFLGCVKYFECTVMTSNLCSSEIYFFLCDTRIFTSKQNWLFIILSVPRNWSSERTSLLDLNSRLLEIDRFRLFTYVCSWVWFVQSTVWWFTCSRSISFWTIHFFATWNYKSKMSKLC